MSGPKMKGKIKHAGKMLKKAREMRGLSQIDLARRMGYPPSFISNGERAESMTTWRFQDTLAALGFELRIVTMASVADPGAVATDTETEATPPSWDEA